MKTFVFSDIHGCYDELMALIRQLPLDPEQDRIVFMGDYIDRGPDSRRVIEQMMAWQQQYPHWVFLTGNHEDMMLDALTNDGQFYDTYYRYPNLWLAAGGRATCRSYLPAGEQGREMTLDLAREVIPEAHRSWCASLPRWFEDERYIYVHGGLKPGRTPSETDPYDLIWLREEFLHSRYDWGKKVVHGHTPTPSRKPEVYANRICIDTALCYAPCNSLTTVELPAERFYSQPWLDAHAETSRRSRRIAAGTIFRRAWWPLVAGSLSRRPPPSGATVVRDVDSAGFARRGGAMLIGASAVILNEAGEVLLVHHTYGRLNWELPGGHGEPGESGEETVLREVREETSLHARTKRLSGVYYEPEVDMHHFVFACVRLDETEMPQPDRDEISECGFWPLDALPRPISDFTIRRIHEAVAGQPVAEITRVPPRQWFD